MARRKVKRNGKTVEKGKRKAVEKPREREGSGGKPLLSLSKTTLMRMSAMTSTTTTILTTTFMKMTMHTLRTTTPTTTITTMTRTTTMASCDC